MILLFCFLQVVSAQLSTHVLQNHDKFVQGINTVASVESDLQVMMTNL